MLLLIHIVVALLGLVVATAALVAPTQTKIRTSYGLLAATLASGVLLVWQTRAPLVSACLSGLLYAGIVGVLIAAARHRLVHVIARRDGRV